MASPRSDPVETEIDRLFDVSPDRFVAERDGLAKRLRSQGDTDAAERVRRLRRPSVAAWALNQLARRHPDAAAELADLGDELRRAQRRALSGVGSEDLRALGARRRRTVEALTGQAAEILAEAGRPPSAAVHQAIASTLDAVALSPDDAARFRDGRLERELVPDSGFGAVDGFTMLKPSGATSGKPRASTPPASARTRADEGARARRRRDAAQAKLDDALRAEEQARDEEQRATAAFDETERAAREAAGRVEEMERALRDARSELDRLRQTSRDARRDVEQARRAAMQAVRKADAARTELEDADGRP